MVPLILQLVESFSVCAKSVVLNGLKIEETAYTSDAKEPFLHLISVTGSRCSKTTSLASTVDATFPVSLKASMQKWKENTLLGFPPASSWRNQSGAEYVYIAGIINAHIETLSSQQTQVFSILIKCFSYKSQMEASIIGQPIKICDMYQL